MQTKIYLIDRPGPGRLAIVPRPRGNDWLADEMKTMRASGVDVLVSMLTDEEQEELTLGSEAEEARACGLEFVAIPTVDRTVPQDDSWGSFRELLVHLQLGRTVAVHCRQSIGRASLAAAAVLVLEGASPEDAWRRVENARGRPVPDTLAQRDWVSRITG